MVTGWVRGKYTSGEFLSASLSSNQISTTYLISEKINKNLSGSGFKSKCECHTNCSDTSKNELEFNQQGITKNKI